MRNKLFASMLVAVFLLTACGKTALNNKATNVTPQVETTATLSALPSSISSTPVIENCATGIVSYPPSLGLAGVLVLDDYKSFDSFLLDAATGTRIQVTRENDRIDEFATSPDRNTLAYILRNVQKQKPQLIISDSRNDKKMVIALDQDGPGQLSWLNNEQLLLDTGQSLLVLNPYTNQQQSYTFDDFPRFDRNNVRNRQVEFDPGLHRAVYKNIDGQVSLIDLDTGQILAEVNDHVARPAVAAWTNDSKQVAVVGTSIVGPNDWDTGDNLFSIDPTGRIQQLTHLAEYYGKGLTISAAGLGWSPNSRYLAFWLGTPQDPAHRQLAVLDTNTSEVTKSCILSSFESSLFYDLPAPIWSPNGKEIMVENRYSKDENHVVILDISKNTVFEIIDNMRPTGWMLPSK